MSLATMVYLADTRIERVVHGQDSWSREIELEIPVSNVELWETQIHTAERMLKFLTGDLWKITLSSRIWQFSKSDEVGEKSNKYDEVSLFSGGMDSLISTINLMEDKKNTLLISHAGEGLTKNAQKNIVDRFDLLYPDVLHTWLDLWMVFPNDYIPEGGNDNNTRSRSFLFIGYAIFTMSGMDNISELLVPENGLIALNVPLDETRVGSFSTRTTHPFYLSLWNELLRGLRLNISVKNPYWNKTKGEMASECKNKDVLYETMKLSFSCSSPGKARWKKLSPQHCGYCVPCLIRRAAMYPQLISSGYDDMSLFKALFEKSHYIGEVGLDFSKEYIQTKEVQVHVFHDIVKLCEQCGEKVVSVHYLKSANTVIEILREYRTQRSNKYIFHWFTGTIPQLEKAIELGCYFSINPSMLKTKSGLEIINTVPVERMLLETDAPFTFKVQHIEEIEKELNRAALKISDIVKSDMMDIFCENAKEVFRY